ncbi:MAG: YcjF family protein [Devosia sp.]
MKPPFARPIDPATGEVTAERRPRAFAPEAAAVPEVIEVLSDDATVVDAEVAAPPRLVGWLGRIVWIAGGMLVSLALGLATERLISDLFATQPWLGWVAVAVVVVLVLALAAVVVREAASLMRLRALDRVRVEALRTIETDDARHGRAIATELLGIYARRPDLARAREELETNGRHVFDGAEHVRLSERLLMAPLDAQARALTAASARRVALVTTVSPRALVDIAFVVFESVRLGGDIARLYGARPGVRGTWRLIGAILAHLAVTGGLVLTDGVVEQLLGQGLAAKLSARLGEGVVNGLMTVRVGIAAMRVVRPLPFVAVKQPMVKDFIPELANVLGEQGR